MSEPAPADRAADRNLLFGVLALQADLLDAARFAEACSAWATRKDTPLADLLVERGWLTPAERADVEKLLARKLTKHGGDARAGLAEVADHGVRETLAAVADPIVHQTLSGLAAAAPTLATTDAFRPAADGTRFQVLRPHARGGLGVVSVARDTELGREVALKEIQVGSAEDPASRGRFIREAEITGGLEHPGVVPVYGLGRYADGRPFYAMRFIRGESLQEAVRKLHAGVPGQTLRGLLTRLVTVCNAVAFAHSRGVIHRDLKPANVMLGPYGETLVVDWGLAKVVGRDAAAAEGPGSAELTLQPPSGEGSATQAGSALGTPAYMSPEQARGEVNALGPATDVYSLGATLYTVLTGQAPVHGRDTAEVLELVRQGNWPPPRQVKASAPKALDAVCRRAMALGPADRYGSALDLAADIEHWLADEPVTAYREPWPARSGRWVRRHRTIVVGAVTAAFVALLAGGAGLLWWQQELARRRIGAEAALDAMKEFQAKARWLDAKAALDQAEDRLGDAGPPELRRRLLSARRDLELVARLDALRQYRAAHQQGSKPDYATADRGYEAAFGDCGMGVPGDDPAAVAARAAASPVREALVAALDDWALVADGKRRAWALEVARRADPDPCRDRLRDPVAWEDVPALARLALDAPAGAVTPALAAALGGRLAKERYGVRMLQAAQAERPGDYWLNLYLGTALTGAGRPGEAEAFCRAALALRPDSATARASVAVALDGQGKLDAALPFYRSALELNPANAKFHHNLGWLLDRQGKLEEAVTCYRKAVEIDPNFVATLHNLGWVLDRQGKLDEAAAYYRKAIDLSPKFGMARNNLGTVLQRQGKLEEAVALYRKALAMDPNQVFALENLGNLFSRQGKFREAAAYHSLALAVGKRTKESRYADCARLTEAALAVAPGLADEVFAVHRYDAACAAALAGCGQGEGAPKPTEAEAARLRTLALAWLWDGLNLWTRQLAGGTAERDEAAKLLRHARVDEDFAGVREPEGLAKLPAAEREEWKAVWAELEQRLGEPGKVRGLAARRRAAAIAGAGSAAAALARGEVLETQGKLPEAAAAYGEAAGLDRTSSVAEAKLAGVLARLDPKYVDALINLGAALRDQGKTDEAISVFRRAVELEPKSAQARDHLGWMLEHQGKLDDAVALYRKATELDPALAQAQSNLARTLIASGRYTEGGEAARRVLALVPATDPRAAAAQTCLRQATLGEKLPAVLRGEARPANAGEGYAFAQLCGDRRQYADAARLAGAAFADDSKLADDLRSFHRYNAACWAALAGCGQGRAAPGPGEERARWRRQSLAWLRADLAPYSKKLTANPPENAWGAAQLRHWLEDTDFAGVRDPSGLAQLPEPERKEWQALWAEVKALLDKYAAR